MAVFQYRPGGKFCENVRSALRQSIHHEHTWYYGLAEARIHANLCAICSLKHPNSIFSMNENPLSIQTNCHQHFCSMWCYKMELVKTHWILNQFPPFSLRECILGHIVVVNLEGFYVLCIFFIFFWFERNDFAVMCFVCAQKL